MSRIATPTRRRGRKGSDIAIEGRKDNQEDSQDRQIQVLLKTGGMHSRRSSRDSGNTSMDASCQPLTKTVQECELDERLHRLTERVLMLEQGKVNCDFTAIAYGERLEQTESLLYNWKDQLVQVEKMRRASEALRDDF